MRESRQFAQADEARTRFSVSSLPTGIGGMGSQYHPGGGSSSQPTLGRSETYREPIEVEIERARYEKEKTTKRWRSAGPKEYRKEGAKQKRIKDMFRKKGEEEVGQGVCQWMVHAGIPFFATESPFFQNMCDVIAQAGPGIQGPNPYQLTNIYLPREVDDLRDYIQSLKRFWPKYGCTIMCDGWTSKTRKSLINFMVYSHRDMIFHKSVDSTGHSKTKEYIFRLMDKVVDEVGEENVVQVVTDNETSFKVAGEMLMNKRKHLCWTPCAAHCVDLMLEEIRSLKHIKEIIDKSRKITSVIYNSAQAVNHMRDNYTGSCDLLCLGITRFATEHVALESLLRHKHPLQRCSQMRGF